MTEEVTFDFAPESPAARDIIRSMVSARWRESFCIANYTPDLWWECDVFEVTKAGYMREYEVKVSRGDFFADRDKSKEVRKSGRHVPVDPAHARFPGQTRWTCNFEKKHDLLAVGSQRGPSLFYYVTPVGLLQPHEIPLWAGLIEVIDRGSGHTAYRFSESTVKDAPRLHRQKVADAVRDHARSVCYYRMHELLLRKVA